jgi:hypothetical protein
MRTLFEMASDEPACAGQEGGVKRVCHCGCERPLDGMRADARWASDACRKRARRANSPDQGRTDIHVRIGPLLEFDVPGDWPEMSARFWGGMQEIVNGPGIRHRS